MIGAVNLQACAKRHSSYAMEEGRVHNDEEPAAEDCFCNRLLSSIQNRCLIRPYRYRRTGRRIRGRISGDG